MKSLEEVKSFLEAQEDGLEYYDAVNGAIESERSAGMSSAKKLKADVDLYRKYKGAFDQLGYDGSDLGEFVSGLSAKIEGSGSSSTELQKLAAQLRQSEASRKDFETKYTTSETKRKNSVLRSALLEAFDGKVHAEDIVAESLINNGRFKLDDSDRAVFVDGDLEKPFGDGIKIFFEERKDILRNTQKPGGGSAGGSGDASKKTMSRSDFDAIGYSEQANFFKNGGTIAE